VTPYYRAICDTQRFEIHGHLGYTATWDTGPFGKHGSGSALGHTGRPIGLWGHLGYTVWDTQFGMYLRTHWATAIQAIWDTRSGTEGLGRAEGYTATAIWDTRFGTHGLGRA